MMTQLSYTEGVRQNQIKITRREWDKLEPSEYLNDVLILFWLKFYQAFVHQHTKQSKDKMYIFDPQFYSKMIGN
jgi:Ulp1 family protease